MIYKLLGFAPCHLCINRSVVFCPLDEGFSPVQATTAGLSLGNFRFLLGYVTNLIPFLKATIQRRPVQQLYSPSEFPVIN